MATMMAGYIMQAWLENNIAKFLLEIFQKLNRGQLCMQALYITLTKILGAIYLYNIQAEFDLTNQLPEA